MRPISSVTVFAAFAILTFAFPTDGNSQKSDSLWKRIDPSEQAATSGPAGRQRHAMQAEPPNQQRLPHAAAAPPHQGPPPHAAAAASPGQGPPHHAAAAQPPHQGPPPHAAAAEHPDEEIPQLFQNPNFEHPVAATASSSLAWYRDSETCVQDGILHGQSVSYVKFHDKDEIIFYDTEDTEHIPHHIPHRFRYDERIVLGTLMRDYRDYDEDTNGRLVVSLLRRRDRTWMLFYVKSPEPNGRQSERHHYTTDELRLTIGMHFRNYYRDGSLVLTYGKMPQKKWTVRMDYHDIAWHFPTYGPIESNVQERRVGDYWRI